MIRLTRRTWGTVAAILVLIGGVTVWRLLHPPLPFTGPYSGQVLDASTGRPISGAEVIATWTRVDFAFVADILKAAVTTDTRGAFVLAPPKERGGWAGTSFSLSVTARGYVDASFIVDPRNNPLPPSTANWPLAVITVCTSLPASMSIALKPDGPAIQQALRSPDPMVRQAGADRMRGIR